jgi:hypothetical protein
MWQEFHFRHSSRAAQTSWPVRATPKCGRSDSVGTPEVLRKSSFLCGAFPPQKKQCGRRCTFRTPKELRESGCLCWPAPPNLASLALSSLLRGCADQFADAVAMPRFLPGCADQVAYAGHFQKCDRRRVFGTAGVCAAQVAYAGHHPKCCSSGTVDTPEELRK